MEEDGSEGIFHKRRSGVRKLYLISKSYTKPSKHIEHIPCPVGAKLPSQIFVVARCLSI